MALDNTVLEFIGMERFMPLLDEAERINMYTKAIGVVGGLYADNLRNVLHTIRNNSETKDFNVEFKHLFKEERWNVFPYINI